LTRTRGGGAATECPVGGAAVFRRSPRSESTAQAQAFSGLDATSDADGFIVAYPQALIPAAGGYEWNIPGVPLPGGQNPPANAANDVTFLTGLVRSLAALRIVRGNDYIVTEYGGCASNAAVELYAIGDEGHEWPGGPPMPAEITRALGPQSDAVDADTTMWAFFQAHPLPAG
jgi:poly(3-hydroxybutyrate) depolymerase